jgi:hypothetical protein
MTLSNAPGAGFRVDTQNALQALASGSKGPTAPATKYSGMDWIDDSGTPWVWKKWDGADWITVGTINATTNAFTVAAPSPAPQGRLTLTSGLDVLSGDVAGATTVYYTPHIGNRIPLYDGSSISPGTFTELSNVLANSATGSAGPAALGPYQVADLFVWDDAGTVRLTRGPKWIATATVTMTLASPCVVTWNGHGLSDGATVRFSTTGGLPTGVAAATDYFITKVDANRFKLSSSLVNQVAGTFINSSVSQSGTHTAENYTSVRGTGAGTTELQRVAGILTNKQTISNGPAANRGTYVGTIYANGSSQVDFKKGSDAAGGGEAIIGLWNAYNRIAAGGTILNSTDSWAGAAGPRPPANSATHRVTAVCGIQGEDLFSRYTSSYVDVSAGMFVVIGVGFNTTVNRTGIAVHGLAYATTGGQASGGEDSASFLGLSYMTAIERVTASTSPVFYGDGGSANGVHSGQSYRWSY